MAGTTTTRAPHPVTKLRIFSLLVVAIVGMLLAVGLLKSFNGPAAYNGPRTLDQVNVLPPLKSQEDVTLCRWLSTTIKGMTREPSGGDSIVVRRSNIAYLEAGALGHLSDGQDRNFLAVTLNPTVDIGISAIFAQYGRWEPTNMERFHALYVEKFGFIGKGDRDGVGTKVKESDSESSVASSSGSRLSCQFIDVGSNIGLVSLHAAAHSCNVTSFEPQAHLVARLRLSAYLNGPEMQSRIKVYLNAVSDTSGSLLYVPDTYGDPNPGGTPVSGVDTGLKSPRAIRSVRLDAMQWECPLFYVKIDVEGHELNVVKGMEGLFQSADRADRDAVPVAHSDCKPEYIQLEVRNEPSIEAAITILMGYGYQCELISDVYGAKEEYPAGRVLDPPDVKPFLARFPHGFYTDLLFKRTYV